MAAKGSQLHLVTDGRARPVGFRELHLGGFPAGLVVSGFEGSHLALAAGREYGGALAVRGSSYAFDDRIDAIRVSAGVGEPFEDDYAQALSQKGPVSGLIESADLPCGGEGRGFGKAREHEGIGEGVEPSGHRHVASPGPEIGDGLADGGQAARAGRVHDEIGAAQVQAVREPSRGDVPQKPWERRFSPRRKRV